MEEQARAYLDQIPFWTRKKNTLDAVGDFLKALGDPQKRMKIIHVAGTNGKGSVCADLTAILTQAGYRVGTFISPHLVDVKERFLLNGRQISEEAFEAGFCRVRAVTEAMMEQGYCHPTFFEFVFLMAMTIYGELQPDFVVLETGLGGRLDTTNAVDRPVVCVITSISLDHTMYLGDTIAKIASEKAGIIKPGIPIIFDDNQPEASAVIRAKAMEVHAPAYPVGEEKSYRDVKFVAPYQAMNAALAVEVLRVLNLPGITDKTCRKGLEQVHWPGRMEQVEPDIWLDGAHNPGGIRAFIRAVKETAAGKASGEQLHLLFAAVSDKDYHEMIRMLCRELPLSRVTVVHLSSERGLDPEILADQFRSAGCAQVEAFGNTKEALHAAIAGKGSGDRLYVVGSLYLIGEIKKLLQETGRKQDA
ncbi:MAG: bifunctional folylpolyglutamate synthase/dihydrofolate synthase [Lachnospiraceae bacterium]|nr:bifunctional folylpolyglutamate synthase/dihydrofolate synthase [Lachnospiraceae bacterium]